MDELRIPDVPMVSDRAARLGRAYHELRRREAHVERLQELAAPGLVVEAELRLRDRALAALRALGWDGAPVKIHRSPYDLEARPSPSPVQVHGRALALAALSERAALDEAGDADRVLALQAWARDLGDEIGPEEAAVIAASPGSLSLEQRIDASWLVEGAAALAWALGRLELSQYDQACATRRVKDALGLLAPLAGRQEKALRGRAEIAAELERLFAVHWRLVDYRASPVAKAFAELGRRSPFWFGPLATEGLPTAQARATGPGQGVVVEDLAIRGRPISEASAEEREECEGIVLERRRALGWLCGLADRYRDAPTDT